VDYARIIEILAQQDYIDGLIIAPPSCTINRKLPLEMLNALVECCAIIGDIPKKYGKPVLAFAMREYSATAMYEILKRGNIPFFESPETCARAMKALCFHAQHRKERLKA